MSRLPRTLSLRERIRAVSAATGEADPGIVAGKVLAELPDSELRPALAETLRDYARHVLAQPLPESPAPTPGKGTHPAQAIRAAYYAELEKSVFGAGGWKRLGDCGEDDLAFMISARREKAAEIAAEADRYEQVRAALAAHRARTVRKLPASVLRALFGGEP